MVGSAAIKQGRSANRKHTYFFFLALYQVGSSWAEPTINKDYNTVTPMKTRTRNPIGLKSNALPLRLCMVNDDACGEQLSPVTTKIALNGSTLLNTSATRALDKKSHPEPLVQIQNNFTIFLMLPSTMIDQNIQLDWTT